MGVLNGGSHAIRLAHGSVDPRNEVPRPVVFRGEFEVNTSLLVIRGFVFDFQVRQRDLFIHNFHSVGFGDVFATAVLFGLVPIAVYSDWTRYLLSG